MDPTPPADAAPATPTPARPSRDELIAAEDARAVIDMATRRVGIPPTWLDDDE